MMIKESNNWKHMDFVQSINNMENMEYKFSRKCIYHSLEWEIGDYNTTSHKFKYLGVSSNK